MKTLIQNQKNLGKQRSKLERLVVDKDSMIQKLVEVDKKIKIKEMKSGQKLPTTDPLIRSRSKTAASIKDIATEINDARIANDKIIDTLVKGISVQDRLKQFSTKFPILLLPIRIQTRFMKVKHVTRKIATKDIVNIKEIKRNQRTKVRSQFNRSVELMDEPSKLNLTGGLSLPTTELTTFTRKDPQNLLPKKTPTKGFEIVPDKDELWVRIYPDDIFVHTHEICVTKSEYNAVEAFWTEIHKADTSNEKPKRIKELKIGAWRALVNAYGTPRAAYLVKVTRPADVLIEENQPVLKSTPQLKEVILKESSWTKAPCTYMMPDQFVVRLISGKNVREVSGKPIPDTLILGLNPEGDDDFSFDKNGDRKIPDEIKWLTDFDEAEKVGMAIKISLDTKERRNGFDRIIVCGVKSSADEKMGKQLLEKLFNNHQHAVDGMAFIRQGTPSNNTMDSDSQYSTKDIDPNKSFRHVLGSPLIAPEQDRTERLDGAHLTKYLGTSISTFQHIYNADSTDVCEAIAMNKALYPGTLGYTLSQNYESSITKSTRTAVRSFFEEYVLGRGSIPALRIGSQPYGIIPATAYSRWKTKNVNTWDAKMYNNVLRPLHREWINAVRQVNYITKPTVNTNNFSKTFLNILGLHASSVKHHQRVLTGPQINQNRHDTKIVSNDLERTLDLFRTLFRYSGGRNFYQSLMRESRELYGPFIEAIKLSEQRSLRVHKGAKGNYIRFLIDCTLKQIREEDFKNFSPDHPYPPISLLYLMLRHAILREHLAVSAELRAQQSEGSLLLDKDFELDTTGLVKEFTAEHQQYLTEVALAKRLPEVSASAEAILIKHQDAPLNVQQEMVTAHVQGEISKAKDEIALEINREINTYQIEQNKFACFEKKFPRLTGSANLYDYFTILKARRAKSVGTLTAITASLEKLENIPTARLERCFAEHLDCCSHRIDAWLQGLTTHRLEKMRNDTGEGIYLGAFGIQESLRPSGTPGIYIKEIKNPKLVDSDGRKVITPIVDENHFRSKTTLAKFIKQSFVYLGGKNDNQIRYNSKTQRFHAAPRVNKNISEGFIHTPSIAQATTAAILKSGYDAYRKSNSPRETLAVNINSKRVRTAMCYLQGMRNGQEIAQLLGYQFERALHDTTSTTLNHLLLEFRNQYPYRANTVHPVDSDETTSAEAYHVVDGLSLLKDFQKKNIQAKKISRALKSVKGQNPIINEIKRILQSMDESMDAVNDLMIAESIYQMVIGSPEGSSAALKVLNESGELNQLPEVVNIPRNGIPITHRVGIQIPIDATANAWNHNKATPKAKVTCNINNWLSDQLPNPDHLCARVMVNDDPADTREVSLSDINIEPIDFILHLAEEADNAQAGYIPTLIKHHLKDQDNTINQDDRLTILLENNQFSNTDKISLFEILPLVKSLYVLITSSRAGLPQDLLPPSQASEEGTKGKIMNASLNNCLTDFIKGSANDSLAEIRGSLNSALSNLASIPEDRPLTSPEYQTYLNLCEELIRASNYDLPAAIPNMDQTFDNIGREIIVKQSRSVIDALDKKLEAASSLLDQIQNPDKSVPETIEAYERLKSIHQLLLGRKTPIYPEIMLENPVELSNARSHPELKISDDNFDIEDWLTGLSVVRPRIKNYQMLSQLREVFATTAQDAKLEVAQVPLIPGANNRWLALGDITDKEHIPQDPLSIVCEYPAGYSASKKQQLLILDEWTETIPDENIDTGIALHYNRPNSEASQNMLLAIPPDETTDHWTWDQLMDTISETLDLAKVRAVEPEHLMNNPVLFNMLPATVAAMNKENNTASLDYNRNNYLKIVGTIILDTNFLQLMHNG